MVLKPVPRQSLLARVQDLQARLASDRDLVLLDIRFTPGKPGRHDSYLAGHLPAARYIDLPDQLADPEGRSAGRGSNPLPSPDRLQADLRRLGISTTSKIVVYDDTNGAAAARAWWVLRWAGLAEVQLLEGGLAAWTAAGLPIETGDVVTPDQGDVTVVPGQLSAIDIDAAAAFPTRGTLIDIRPTAQFGGKTGGHIPGARSFPVDWLIDAENRPIGADALIERLAGAGIDLARPVAAYCGGGVASTLFALALTQIGKDVDLYPGSWSEWTTGGHRPVERG